MKFEEEIKIVADEINGIMINLGLEYTPRSRAQILDNIAEGLGYTNKTALEKDYPCLSTGALKDCIDRGLKPIVEGNENIGYSLKKEERKVVNMASYALNLQLSTNLSLNNIFSGSHGAISTAEILYNLRDGKAKRIQDICNETGLGRGTPGKNLKRLSELGIVKFEGYREAEFLWNPNINSFSGIEDNIIKSIPFEHSNYRIHRAREVAKQLFDNREKQYSLTEVEHLISHRFSPGKTNRNITASALRVLERLGYVQVSHDLRASSARSKVQVVLDEKGRNPFVDLVSLVKEGHDVQKANIGWSEAAEILEIFAQDHVKKENPEIRKDQITNYLKKVGRATSQDIRREIGMESVNRYLQDLEEEGRIVHEEVKNRFFYQVAEKSLPTA